MNLYPKWRVVHKLIDEGTIVNALEFYNLEQSGVVTLPEPIATKPNRKRAAERLYSDEQCQKMLKQVRDFKQNLTIKTK